MIAEFPRELISLGNLGGSYWPVLSKANGLEMLSRNVFIPGYGTFFGSLESQNSNVNEAHFHPVRYYGFKCSEKLEHVKCIWKAKVY